MGIAGGPDVELIKLELTGAVNKLKT